MKRITSLTLFAFFCVGIITNAGAQNVGINTSGANPSVNAILDLNTGNGARNLGFIVPNVTLGASLATFNPPIANAATAGDKGMLVYNSNAANQPIGYYYWNGATWVSVSGAGAAVTGAQNGLTMNGTLVELGGANPLLGNTSIISGGNNLAFTGTGIFQLGQGSNSTGTLQFLNSTNNRNISISAGVTTGSYALTLPLAQGAANTVLTNNGAGVLSWAAAAGATANNGLTVVGGNVQLGGANPLLGNTAIISGGNNLAFTGTGIFQLGQGSTSTGTLQFLNANNNRNISISAGTTTNSYALTLPLTQGAAGTVLTNNGAGVLSWGAGATVTGAQNGLTLNGPNVELGGANPLLGNTNIISGGFNLAFTGTGNFQLGQASTSTGELDFLNAGSANLVGISAGATTANYNLTLPLAQGAANTFLMNNGAGVLTWTAAGGAAANNGLTIVGGNVQLGGANPLLGNTTITNAGFNLAIAGTGKFQLGVGSASTGELDFFNGASALGVGLKSAATTTTYTLSLPVTPPASNGQVLASSIGGTLSWATIPAGGPGILIGIIYVTSTTGTLSLAGGTTSVLVRAIGGGGAGGGAKHIAGCGTAADEVGGGGGAGGYCEGFVSGMGPGSTYQVNIGAGGVGVANCGAVNGGNTVVTITGPNTVFTANGGAGGPSYENVAAGAFTGGAGGTAAGGNLNITGATGGWCSVSTTGTDGDFAGSGANSSFGSGGSSIYTRDHLAINGVPATAPGAGGGGAVIAQSVNGDAAAGGNGASGIVIIYEYQ